jgi:hypothetical protein
MHNRAKFHSNPNAGIKAGEKVWKEYLERLKKRTKELNENILSFTEFITEKKDLVGQDINKLEPRRRTEG